MKKIDRLGWAAGMSFTAFGVRVGIRANSALVLERVLPCLPPSWRPASEPNIDLLYSFVGGGAGPRTEIRRFNVIYAGVQRLARTLDLDEALQVLESDIQLRIAESAPRRVFVHAGVVGWRGRAMLIPGRSFSGKTSLVAALVRAGATYYSDEYAVLDARGRVHAYPRPLSIRQEDGMPTRKCPPEELGGVSASKPLPVGLVVVTKYRAGARWRPRELSAGQGVLALFANTIPARRKPENVFAALQHAVSHARVLKGTRGEARETVNSLLKESLVTSHSSLAIANDE